ncbi:MAG: protein translocase subunit SecF [Candidatus Peregrinibacteria bacterium]
MKKYLSWKILAIIIVALFLSFFDLPANTQSAIVPFTPEAITKSKIYLGLDLQGGSQLDYKIDLRKVPEADQESVVEGVKEVIEKRVNSLGVAEPNIYISDIGGEQHIIVELAETATITQEDIDMYLGENKTVDELTDDEKKLVGLEKAKATVGKTIQLEFKEEKGSLDPQEKDKIHTNALDALNKIKGGEDFSIVGQEEEQAYPGKVTYEKSGYVFENEITPERTAQTVKSLKPGEFTQDLIETGGSFTVNKSGEAVEATGLAIVKLTGTKEAVKNEKEIDASHILISWSGLASATAEITRTEDEAYALAKEIKQKLDNSADFAALAKEYSDDASNKDMGGKLNTPVTGEGTYVYDFEQTALALQQGQISDIIKTEFGYHIIKANKVSENVSYPQYQYETITYSTTPDPWKETGLTGKQFVHADVELDKFYQPYVLIQFNDEGAKLFEELTTRNINKKIAIFVGGDLISAPVVNEKISGGVAQITGQFTNEEAQNLARDLNTGAIPAPIVLTGEYTIGATLGHEALSTSLFAGLLGLLLIMIFMVWNYRVAGLIANAALAIYAVILIFLIKSHLNIGVALVISLGIFIFLVSKIVNNKDSGWEKVLSFLLSCIAFFFLTFLLKTGVVLTLAGVAGIILSLGMAVDANILIFERFKEEIREGKSFGAALDAGFARAWSAIRDSNFSTLITCAILFYFGSSIIRGFAFNLAAGILVSMFTAITITKTLLQGFVGKKIAENLSKFGISQKSIPRIGFIKKSKTWMTISASMVGISLIAIIVFGLNLGIDFKGGTLMEFDFKEPVTKEQLTDNLKTIGDEIQSETSAASAIDTASEPSSPAPSETAAPLATSVEDQVISMDGTEPVDLSKIQIIQSGDTDFIVKTKYISEDTHNLILQKMKERLPEFTEARFTTIGPTIGNTLLQKAIFAIIIAIITIIIYIGLAFRKIPREVSPWRFGFCAIIALVHDIIIVTGIFVILGKFLNVEIDALFITAMLTVFGYSVNDTIIIFDRIRENLIRHSGEQSLTEITDNSLNETLRRSINTSLSTIIALVAVLIWGSPSIFYFVLALTLGTVVGTYSSIFTASPIAVMWNKWADKKKANS